MRTLEWYIIIGHLAAHRSLGRSAISGVAALISRARSEEREEERERCIKIEKAHHMEGCDCAKRFAASIREWTK